MGEQKVHLLTDKKEMRNFIRSLLEDVKALDYMLKNDWFESDVTRIGAEQEMVLVNKDNFKPAMVAQEAMELMKEHDWLETELAKFNLEITLTPQLFTGNCLRKLEIETRQRMKIIKQNLATLNALPMLTGILPTLRKFDLSLDNITPKKRYLALMDAIDEQHLGSDYELRITGIDELIIKHDSPMLEACNNSFQVHLQIASHEFVKMYNIAQMLAAPVMAIAANSPLVFGRRLWHETRIAMFQQSIDTRSAHKHLRERSPRVNFGKDWLHSSILEIYREDIARFRVLMSEDIREDSIAKIQAGEVPKLKSLQVHNSTIYRWNRPCYGISENGKPHLRIENRVLPAGPTIMDEIANAAFWLGLMMGFSHHYEDITQLFAFADVRDNFMKAARYGIDSTFTWMHDKKIGVCELILTELLPIAREGLLLQKVHKTDIDRYLSVIEERAKLHATGARWILRAYTNFRKEVDKDEALTVVTAIALKHQMKKEPVHTWPLPELKDLKKYKPTALTVGECMTTDVFTVRKEDIIELVGEMMDWRKIRFMPVEDEKARLLGLVTHHRIMRELLERRDKGTDSIAVEDIMITDVVYTTPHTSVKEAMQVMRKNKVGCLPVVNEHHELVGIITEMDFLRITARLLDRLEDSKAKKIILEGDKEETSS